MARSHPNSFLLESENYLRVIHVRHNPFLKIEHSTVFHILQTKLNTNMAGSHQDSFPIESSNYHYLRFLLINPIFSVMYPLIHSFSLNIHILFLVPSFTVSILRPMPSSSTTLFPHFILCVSYFLSFYHMFWSHLLFLSIPSPRFLVSIYNSCNTPLYSNCSTCSI